MNERLTPQREADCRPTVVLSGDQFCLELDCDHELIPGENYCTEVGTELVCDTHSTFVAGGVDYEELVEAATWPCERQKKAS